MKEAILPRLGYAPDAEVTKDALYAKMTQWLRMVKLTGEDVEICFDYQSLVSKSTLDSLDKSTELYFLSLR